MNRFDLNIATIFKLVLWSTAVGALLYWLEWSTGEIFSWVANHIAAAWAWVAATGIKYIVIPFNISPC